MFLVKVLPLCLILIILSLTKGQEVNEEHVEITTLATKPSQDNDDEIHSIPPSTNNQADSEAPKPPRPSFGAGNPPPPNIFQNVFNHFLRPMKNTGKTYGPNIIAIVGDKPYISLEVFNKFSPFKWLMNAFQGKIQNICGVFAPPMQGDFPMTNPENFLQQLIEDSQKPAMTGSRPPVWNSGPIRVFDIPANSYRNNKKKST